MDAELREQPTPDEGAYDSNEKIADNPKPGALHDLAGQPSGDEADHQYNQETFTRHIHLRILSDSWTNFHSLRKRKSHQQGQPSRK